MDLIYACAVISFYGIFRSGCSAKPLRNDFEAYSVEGNDTSDGNGVLANPDFGDVIRDLQPDGIRLKRQTPEGGFDQKGREKATEQSADHMYYYQHIYPGEAANHYVDIKEELQRWTLGDKVIGHEEHPRLTDAYRRAFEHKVHFFEFPFYGFPRNVITITTGGFLYVGDTQHSWLAATQYIAPLMANFDTEHDNSSILYLNMVDKIVVEWRDVRLRGQEDRGSFTFQVVLQENGDIKFIYVNIPMNITEVSDVHHPLKVGTSDAYVGNSPDPFDFKRRVIYEYHRINVDFADVKTGNVIVFKARESCGSFKTCHDCTTTSLPNFNCTWCAVPEAEGASFCTNEEGKDPRMEDFGRHECHKLDQSYCEGDPNPEANPNRNPNPESDPNSKPRSPAMFAQDRSRANTHIEGRRSDARTPLPDLPTVNTPTVGIRPTTELTGSRPVTTEATIEETNRTTHTEPWTSLESKSELKVPPGSRQNTVDDDDETEFMDLLKVVD